MQITERDFQQPAATEEALPKLVSQNGSEASLNVIASGESRFEDIDYEDTHAVSFGDSKKM